jgi:hypothetical protein
VYGSGIGADGKIRPAKAKPGIGEGPPETDVIKYMRELFFLFTSLSICLYIYIYIYTYIYIYIYKEIFLEMRIYETTTRIAEEVIP